METDITIARIANAICQDSTFNGIHLLVEGKQDYKLYSKFIQSQNVRIKVTQGKYRLREAYKILIERGLHDKVVGIRDADFLRIKGNQKYAPDYADAIFPTDCHDSEIMLAFSGAVDNYLALVCDPDQIKAFAAKFKPALDLGIEVIYPLGCLRLASKRFDLGLSFKPERPEGNQLKIRKFISEITWENDIDAMINTVWEYSQNRGMTVATKVAIKDALVKILDEKHPPNEISNGHDFCAVLHLISTKGLKSSNKMLQDSTCVHDLLIANYDFKKFELTELYNLIQGWISKNDRQAIFVTP